MLRVGLIGAGDAGRKRAAAVRDYGGSKLVAICDQVAVLAQNLAVDTGARTIDSWQAAVDDGDCDVIVVSTTHDMLAPISAAALAAGKHVLCEKPMGRNTAEVRLVLDAAERSGTLVSAGYNHRFLPAVAALQRLVSTGGIGTIDFIRGRYGHGGRPGYDREWRGDAERAGGGELLDQGAHLIDLCLWLLGDFESVTGHTTTRCWDIEPLEDNAFGLFRTASGQVASIHVSWTQWRNLFSLEVFGGDGYAIAEGRGGSYGPQRLTIGRRASQGGAPSEEITEFGEEDDSWSQEWRQFASRIELGVDHGQAPQSALETMSWIRRLYAAAAGTCVVTADQTV